MSNLISKYTHTHTHTHTHTDPPYGRSNTVALEDLFDRVGLRGYVQFNKYTHITHMGDPYP